MVEYGKKLSRQVARYLGSAAIAADLTALLADQTQTAHLPEAVRALLGKLPAFLAIVDASYAKYEENVSLAERSLALSSDELMIANRAVRTMVNCLGQGFLMFGPSGVCDPVYSQACLTLLETVPAGKPITEVLRLDSGRAERFTSLFKLVFTPGHVMSLTEIMRFAPRRLEHSSGRHLAIDYRAERGDDGTVTQIVVIITDITEQIAAETQATAHREKIESIERILQDRQAFASYVRHLQSALADMDDGTALMLDNETLLRELHTLKGGAGAFRLAAFEEQLHACETAMAQAAENRQAIIADFRPKLEALLLELAARLQQLVGIDINNMEQQTTIDRTTIYGFANVLAARGLPDLRRKYIEQVCMESLQQRFRYFDLVIGDMAERLNKRLHPVKFVTPDVKIMPGPYQSLLAALVHIVRNIVDHGIEPPSVRAAQGKDLAGTITVVTSLIAPPLSDRWLHIRISDDGAGFDMKKLRQKLSAADPAAEWLTRPESDVLHEIFARGTSSRDVVSHYSGRGIGLAALYQEVIRLGGKAHIETTTGAGTSFDITVPYIIDP